MLLSRLGAPDVASQHLNEALNDERVKEVSPVLVGAGECCLAELLQASGAYRECEVWFARAMRDSTWGGAALAK